MKKFFFKFFVIFLLLFSFNINASEINSDYIEYEKLDSNIKENIDYVPSEYIVYYDTSKYDNMFLRRNLNAFYSATPSSYDLRNVSGKRLIPPIDNQGSLGLCWAFASNNVLESYYLKNNKGTIDLSDDQPSYVSKYFGDAEFGKGNSVYNTLRYWLMGYSPISEDVFGEYSLTEKNVTYKDYLDNENLLFDIKNVKVFPALNIPGVFSKYNLSTALSVIDEYNKDIKTHIMNYGAIFAGTFWYFYDENKNLVYNNGELSYSSYATSAHAVTIIGWDDNYEGVSINGTPVKGAWLAMNSWGDVTDYFYISYYDVDTVKSLFGVTSVAEKKWNNSYINYELYSENGTKKVYEFRKSSNLEKIESVKLLYKYNDTTAKVYISDGFNTYSSTTSNDVTYGIKTYEFEDINFDSEKLYITVDSTYDSSYFDIALFTSDVLENKVLEFEELEFNNFDGGSNSYNLYSKNISTGKSVTVQIFDDKNNNITSKFNINKPVIINDYSNISINAKSSLSDYEYIRIEASVDGVSTSLINYINGDGTVDNPYVIRTPYEMMFLSYDGFYSKLGNTIDLDKEIKSTYGLFYNDGYGWEPFNFKNSYLDGNGFKIKNLSSKLGGLFLNMNNSTIKNIKLEKFIINNIGENSSSSIVAVELDNNSKISNVYIDNASIVSNSVPVGGIVGFMYDGEISDIYIRDSDFSSDISLGLITFSMENPKNAITVRNVFSNNTSLNGTNKALVSTYLYISSTSANLKPINVKYNIFNFDEDIKLFKSETIKITDNNSYNIYDKDLILLSNDVKKDSEIYDASIFSNYNMISTWSFDNANSAYLKLFEDEFIVVDDSLIKLNKYKMETNLIYQVNSNTSKNEFVKDILNLSELSYVMYSSSGSELSSSDYVSTGSYIDVNKGNTNQRYYIIVTGDIDGNGSSGAIDAYGIVLHTIAKKELTGKYLLAADYNLDGSVGARDAYAIVLDSIK